MLKKDITELIKNIFKKEKSSNNNIDKENLVDDTIEKECTVKIDENRIYRLNVESNIFNVELKVYKGRGLKVDIENYEKVKKDKNIKFEISEISNQININNSVVIINAQVISGESSSNSEVIAKTKLNIYIPQSIKLSDIIIKTTSSDIKVADIKLEDEILLESVSGDLTLKNIKCKNLKLKATSGDIQVSNSILHKVRCETFSGDCIVEKSEINILDCKTTSGNVDICRCDGEETELISVSGDILASALKYRNIDMHTTSGDVSLNNKGILEYEIQKLKTRTLSGSEKILANYKF